MVVQFAFPLSKAYSRMKNILFKPFNIGKWFALGFTAFLADLIDTPGGGGGGKFEDGDFNWDDVYNFPSIAMDWLDTHPFWMAVIIAGIVVLIVLYVVFTWLSSRGMFMFLDNVVHNRTLIEKPWREFKNHGNSLFLWRLAFGVISFTVLIAFVITVFLIFTNIYISEDDVTTQILLIAGTILIGFMLFVLAVFISIFLENFVVPIMYKSNLSVTQAWRKFLGLFSKNSGYFILYGLFIIGLLILVVIAVVIAGFFTCCCGFLLLAIPYIGSVIMLPVSVTYRALSLEFLAQFGDDYKIFLEEEIPQPGSDNFTAPVI